LILDAVGLVGAPLERLRVGGYGYGRSRT
jgi:hypothetical protein